MHFHTIFRRLGHKLKLRQRFKDLDTNEPLKEVCSNSRSSALWHFILFHFPAVLVTTMLLVLYVKNIHWAQYRPTTDELGALQFAAKVQESLILISLTDILLHRIRYGLLSRNGVQLGFLSSPFNIGFSLRYLVSREFWSAMLSPIANRHFHGLTAAIIFILALLGLAAGPSSAIAMIPRYDWWRIQSPPLTPLSYVSSWENQSYDILRRDPYTMKLESQHIRSPETCSIDPESNEPCVNQNLPLILQTLKGLIMGITEYLSQNITVPSPAFGLLNRPITFGADEFILANVPEDRNFGQLAFAATPMDFVAGSLMNEALISQAFKTLFRSEALKLSGKGKWKQPLVAVHCAPSAWPRASNQTSATFDFGDRLYDNFTVSLDLNDTFQLHNIPINADDEVPHAVTTIFPDIQHLFPVPITASILFVSSFMAADLSADTVEENVPWMVAFLCPVQARWVEAEVWLYPMESMEVQSHLGFPISDTMQYIRQKSGPENTINMTTEWLRDIGVPLNSDSTPRENPAYQQGYNLCTPYNVLMWGCLPAFLAVYLAEALSQSPKLEYSYQRSSGLPSPDPNSTVIYTTYFEHVYAYGFRESTTIRIAFIALFLQVFIALIHLALTVFVRRPWHCSAWGNFGQLLTLTLRSRPPDELSNVGAGVQNSRTWRLMAVVREIGDDRQLEMVVGAPTAMSRQGQTNTNVDERGATQMSIPQIGTKYG